jgi:hypothetical protein
MRNFFAVTLTQAYVWKLEEIRNCPKEWRFYAFCSIFHTVALRIPKMVRSPKAMVSLAPQLFCCTY